jgi:hypothetical protein
LRRTIDQTRISPIDYARTVAGSNEPELRMRLGWSSRDGGLIWGGFVLLLAFAALALLIPYIRDATREVPTLSPETIRTIELDDVHGQLVEVSGFELDCDDLILDGRRVLAPAWAPDRATMIVVALEYGSKCRKLGASFRGDARVRNSLRNKMIERGFIDVEPRWFPRWALEIVLGFAALGLLGIGSALIGRKQRLAQLQTAIAPRVEPVAPELADPYRPGQSDRIITESLRPSSGHLAKLRRRRILRLSGGLVLLATALVCAIADGQRIRMREQTWSDGIEPIDAEVVGKSERVALGIVHTEIDVAYVDRHGRAHRERMTATSFRSDPDTTISPTVRYLRDEPERFNVSWVHEQARGSLILLALVSASLLGGAIASLASAWRNRNHELTATIFEDPREALLDLLSVERHHPGADRDMVTYHFRVRDSVRRCSVVVGRGQVGPLFLDRAESVALALYNPRQRTGLLVLSEDLRELEQPPFTAAQLRGRYRARMGQSPANPPPPRRRRRG